MIFYPSYSKHSLAFEDHIVVSSGPIILIGFTVYNSGVAQFIQLHDAASLPADTAIPVLPLPIAAADILPAYWGTEGRLFENGLVICNSSTDNTKTIGGDDCWFDVQVRAVGGR